MARPAASRSSAAARSSATSRATVDRTAVISGGGVPPAPDPIVAPNLTDILLGTMALSATFASISIEVPYTGDTASPANDATATLRFKKTADGSWRTGFALWRTVNGIDKAFRGSVLLCDANTGYDIEVTVTDPDHGSAVLTGSVTTRAENITAAGSLVATHFVNASTGNDSNNGTSAETAWATIRKAIASAPAASIVQVASGYYTVSGQARTVALGRLTLVAANPAVDDSQAIINASNHAVIEYGPSTAAGNNNATVTGPTGAGDVPAGQTNVWTSVELVGPNSGVTYTLWKWASSPISSALQMGYAATRAATPQRVPHWKMTSGWSDAKRAEFMFANNRHRYGFFTGLTATDIYLLLPLNAPNSDPNQLYITIGKGIGIDLQANGTPVDGSNTRLSGFEIRGFETSVKLSPTATFGVIDHCLFSTFKVGVAPYATQPGTYGADHVIQRNRFLDSNLRSAFGVAPTNMIPWDWIKYTSTDGFGGSVGKAGEYNETTAVWGRGGCRRQVARYNTIDGPFNGFGNYSNGYDKYSASDSDFHNNTLTNIADDCFESEPNGINNRIWLNTCTYVTVFLSVAQANYGPLYVFRNTSFQHGIAELVADLTGAKGMAGLLVKVHGGHSVAPQVRMFNNTFWSNQTGSKGWQITNGGTSNIPYWWLRNNIVECEQRTVEWDTNLGARWDEDYNIWVVTDQVDVVAGHKYAGTVYRTTDDLATYRTLISGAAQSNKVSAADISFLAATTLDAELTNVAGGDLTLKVGSALIDVGVVVPNLERSGTDYLGAGPDLGATEKA